MHALMDSFASDHIRYSAFDMTEYIACSHVPVEYYELIREKLSISFYLEI